MVVVYVDTGVRFLPGRIVSTPGAVAAFEATGEDVEGFLERHLHGDWGDVSSDDARANEDAVDNELRILSAYRLRDQTKIWIITEADRSATTFLLPEEY